MRSMVPRSGLVLASALIAALGAAPRARAQQRVAEVQVAPPFLRMHAEDRIRLVATAYDSNGVPLDAPVRWSSSNINVAEVGQDGMVRALAPGVSVVSAIFETGGRRRIGQAAVFVLRERLPGEPQGPGFPGTPGPPPPPAGAAGPPQQSQLDSATRASVDCSEPFLNAVNPLRACYDTRPILRAPPSVAVPAQCGPGVSPVRLLVLVGEDGAVQDARLFIPSTCSAYTDAALAQARRLTFEAAMRGGQPVRAWTRVLIRTSQ